MRPVPSRFVLLVVLVRLLLHPIKLILGRCNLITHLTVSKSAFPKTSTPATANFTLLDPLSFLCSQRLRGIAGKLFIIALNYAAKLCEHGVLIAKIMI